MCLRTELGEWVSMQDKNEGLTSLRMLWRSSTTRVAVALAALVFTLGACHGVAAGGFNPLVALALAVAMAVSLVLGAALCGWLGLQDADGIDTLHALLLGMVALSTLLMALGLTTPLSVSGNFFLVSLLAGAMHLYLRQRERGAQPQAHAGLYLDGAVFFALAMILIAAVFWSVENLRGLHQVEPDLFESHPWHDMFGQSVNVSRFMNPRGAASLGNEQLLGFPLQIYHYGSYMIPAFVGRVSGAQAYSLATSILPVLGMLWTGMAAYVLGKTCSGARVGAIAVMGVLFVPDPSFWGLGNSWTGYFFLQQVGMGGLYGVAVLALASAHGFRAAQMGSARLLVSAALLIAVAAFYKVQIVLVYGMPLLVILLWFFHPLRRYQRLAAIAATVIAYVALVSLMAHIPRTPTLGFSTAGAAVNMRQIAIGFPPALSAVLVPLFPDHAGYLQTLLRGVPLVLVTTYGIWLAVLASGMRLLRGKAIGQRFAAALAFSAMATHLVVACALEPNYSGRGDLFEIMHKTLVWPYFVVATASAILVGTWWVKMQQSLPVVVARTAVAVACTAAVVLVAVAGPTTQSSSIWAGSATRIRIPRDYYEAAEYLRTHTPADAVVQFFENDPILSLTALSERKSFVAHCVINCGPMPVVARERVALLMKVLNQADVADVRSAARGLGIDWLVMRGRSRAWQASPAAADAAFGDYFLYSTSPHAG